MCMVIVNQFDTDPLSTRLHSIYTPSVTGVKKSAANGLPVVMHGQTRRVAFGKTHRGTNTVKRAYNIKGQGQLSHFFNQLDTHLPMSASDIGT